MRLFDKDLYWIRSGFFSVLQSLSGLIFSLGSFYLLLRILGPHDYGVWVLFMVTATILETVRNGLIQNALIKFLASEEKESHGGIITASAFIGSLLTVCCIVVILALSGPLSSLWKSPELQAVFYLYCVVFIISGVSNQLICVLQANLRFKEIFVGTFFTQVLFFSFVFTTSILNLKIHLIHLVSVQIFSAIITALLSFYFARPYLLWSPNEYKVWVVKLFNYGKYAFGTSVSAILSVTVDQMMLGAILNPASAGAFNVAVRISNFLDIPTNAVAVIVFPQSAKRIVTEGKEGIKYLYEKSVGTLLALLVPGIIVLFLFSELVVKLIAGNNYQDAVPLLHITLLYCLFSPYGRQFGNILDSIGKTRLTFLVVLAVALINLSLNYVFITRMGVMGAALATLIAHIIGFAIGQTILRRELDISIRNTFTYALQFYPEFYQKYLKKNKPVG